MTKISPTDKIFDELIPDSPEYWEAIENIDYEPKPKRGFWVAYWADIKNYFVALVQEAVEETDTTFTPIKTSYFADYLEELYPDVDFSVMKSEITIFSKGARCKILREYEGWDINSEQEYKNLLAKVKNAVDVIRKEQSKISALKEARKNRIRGYK
jgi:hypothetical protein